MAAREKVAVGFHLASGWHDPKLPLDVGFGYVRNGWNSRDLEYSPGELPILREPSGGRAVPQGFYLEARPRVAGGEFWRSFVGGRIEAYVANQTDVVGVGVLARASIEGLYPVVTEPVAGRSGKKVFFGIAHGVIALGAYAETGYQRWPTGEAGAVLGIGITARIPGVVGVACCVDPTKRKKNK